MRKFLKAAGMLVLATLALMMLLIAAAYAAGTVWISVQEKRSGGHHLILAVPAVLIPIGLRLAPHEMLREFSEELRPWLPVIRSASSALERCPDARLVEVRSSKESVDILKRGKSLVIDVDSGEDRVHVSFPVAAVPAVTQRLEGMQGPV